LPGGQQGEIVGVNLAPQIHGPVCRDVHIVDLFRFAAAEEGGIRQRAGGAELEQVGILIAGEDRLPRVEHRKIGGEGLAAHVGIAGAIRANGIAFLRGVFTAAQEGHVD